MLCISLFQATGVEILIREIDISPRNPTRRATPDSSLVEYKFTRRIAEEKVTNAWKFYFTSRLYNREREAF